MLAADPYPEKQSGAPIYSPHGLILFPRHSTLSAKVWSSTSGYPGDVDYREFYRDIGHDREWTYIALDTLRYYYSQFGLGVDTGIDLPENQVNNGLIGDMTQGGSLLHNTFGQYDN